MKKELWLLLCLVSAVLADNATATVYYWDPEGTTAPTVANLASTWNTTTTQWSTTSAQTASGAAWVSGYAADFSAGAAPGTPYIVTVNSAITIGGIFDGLVSSAGSFVNLNGSGSLVLAAGADAFYANGSDGGTITINVPMTGSGQVALEGVDKMYFDATNTYSGGTSIGYSGVASYSGTLTFSNGYAFGTGPIQITTSSGGATLQEGGTAAMTVANAFTVANVAFNITPNAGGLTLSGPWALSTTPIIGVSANLLNISGQLSGAGGFTKFGAGTVALSGTNAYTGLTTVSNGVLSITADNNLGAVPSVANYDFILSGGTVNASNTFTLNSNRLISLTASSSISVAAGKTLSYAGTIGGTAACTKTGNGTLALSGVSAYSGSTTISAGTLEADSQTGSTTSTNSVNISSGGTLSGLGLVSGMVSGAGKISPGTSAGPATLTLGNGLNLSSGGTYVWNLSTNDTSSGFSSIALNGGNLTLNGTSKLSINLTGTASAPSTNNPFWLSPEAWEIVSENGTAGNSNSTSFASIVNGSYAAGTFTNYPVANGLTLLYQPNFPYFDALSDSGAGFFSGENLIFTNFSGLSLYVWFATNATLPVSNWTLVGQMAEQTLAPTLPGYSRYSINVNPVVSPTYFIAGNKVTGPYLPGTVTASIITTPDAVNFTVVNTNVAINTAGVLELVPYPPVASSGMVNSSGQFQFQFTAETNLSYVVQASPDLVNWSSISTGLVSALPVTFVDANSTNYASQFYRVLLP